MKLRVMKCVLAASLVCLCGCSAQNSDAAQSVSKAEYYAAAQKAAQCMRDEGLEVTEPEEIYGAYSVGMGGGTSEEIERVYDKCWGGIVSGIEKRYLDGLALSGKAWEDKYREFIGCLEEAGVEGVEVGDEEGKVGTAISGNTEGVECMQNYMWYLFRGKNTGINAE